MATRLASTDVTITLQKTRILRGSPGGARVNTVKIVFGDGAKSYDGTNKVPMPTYPSFGLMKELEYLTILQDALATVNYHWKWDFVNKRLVGYRIAATVAADHTHDLLIKGTTATNNADTVFLVGDVIRQNNITADNTIAGNTTNGGVQLAGTLAIAAGGLTEIPDDTVIAAQTLYAQAWGW